MKIPNGGVGRKRLKVGKILSKPYLLFAISRIVLCCILKQVIDNVGDNQFESNERRMNLDI